MGSGDDDDDDDDGFDQAHSGLYHQKAAHVSLMLSFILGPLWPEKPHENEVTKSPLLIHQRPCPCQKVILAYL